jgi:hypothetical protein
LRNADPALERLGGWHRVRTGWTDPLERIRARGAITWLVPGTVRVGSTSGAASISIVPLGQAGEAKLVEGIEAFGIASLPAVKARSPACNPAAGPQQWRGAPPRTGRLDRQPQLPEENRAVKFRGPKDSLRRQQCSNDRAGQSARRPYPEAPGIVAQQRRESQAAHSGGVGNMDLSRQNWNQAPAPT